LVRCAPITRWFDIAPPRDRSSAAPGEESFRRSHLIRDASASASSSAARRVAAALDPAAVGSTAFALGSMRFGTRR
jgi:hypothetical protein